mgnify:CR=1 FL=1
MFVNFRFLFFVENVLYISNVQTADTEEKVNDSKDIGGAGDIHDDDY